MNPLKLIAGHWRGQYDLFLTLLLIVLGLRIGVGWLQPGIPVGLLIPWLGSSAVLLVWQVVGALRAGDNHLKVRGDMMLYWCTIIAVVVAVVLAGMQTLDGLSRVNPPIEKQQPTVAMLPLADDGKTVYLSGDLGWDLRRSFLKTLDHSPDVKTVQLQSNGGLVFVGRALALAITDRGLNTRTEGTCYSACTIVFMAGVQRTLGKQGVLGFHQYAIDSLDKTPLVSIGGEQHADRLAFARQGVSEDFLRRVFDAGHSDMWFVGAAELHGTGVLTTD